VFYTHAGRLRPTSAHAGHFTAVFLCLKQSNCCVLHPSRASATKLSACRTLHSSFLCLKQSYFCDLHPCRGSEANFSACRTLHCSFPVFQTVLLLCSTPMQGLCDQTQRMPYTSQQFSCVYNRAIDVFYTHAGPLRPNSAHAVQFIAVFLCFKQSYCCVLHPCRASETNFNPCPTLHSSFPVIQTELLLCSTRMQGL
jgi:hypothetical protein